MTPVKGKEERLTVTASFSSTPFSPGLRYKLSAEVLQEWTAMSGGWMKPKVRLSTLFSMILLSAKCAPTPGPFISTPPPLPKPTPPQLPSKDHLLGGHLWSHLGNLLVPSRTAPPPAPALRGPRLSGTEWCGGCRSPAARRSWRRRARAAAPRRRRRRRGRVSTCRQVGWGGWVGVGGGWGGLGGARLGDPKWQKSSGSSQKPPKTLGERLVFEKKDG